MTDHARVVIIGGGAVGCSTLYHLAKMGWTDCLLLEMNELSSGSTWHAAGNVPNFSTSWNIIKLQRHSSKLYARLGDEVGYPINYHVTGSIRLANNKARMDEYRHVAAMARAAHTFEMSQCERPARNPTSPDTAMTAQRTPRARGCWRSGGRRKKAVGKVAKKAVSLAKKGVGAAVQPATVSSSQAMSSAAVWGCWPASARGPAAGSNP